MIIYENTLGQFKQDVILNQISDKIIQNMRDKRVSGGSFGEQRSWENSLHFLKDALDCPEISNDCSVAIEYNIPQTSKRVDFMILGSDKNNKDNIVIIELKQWAKVQKVDDYSKHSILSDLKSNEPTAHPSYQVFSYKSLIVNYCEDIKSDRDMLHPCAYLHNMDEKYRTILEDNIYSEWIDEAPVFLKKDVLKLRNFVSQYVNAKASDGTLLYKIEHGRIKPQKSLQDSIDSMLCGNEEFKMIDDQVVAYDIIMKTIKQSTLDNRKHVLIIQGGPGTGKSVLAINVLANCITKLGLNASYITKNSAPRNCYNSLLTNGNAKRQVDLKLAIKSPHSLPFIPTNGLDVGIFDEAHRMQQKPFMYKGNDMLNDAIKACRVSVFFIDEDQRITVDDCYSIDSIKEVARQYNAIIDIDKFELKS